MTQSGHLMPFLWADWADKNLRQYYKYDSRMAVHPFVSETIVGPHPALLYCVIAVLLNGFALGWSLWKEIEFTQVQASQINELQIQLKAHLAHEPLPSRK
ncbi:MAG: hypothetical protein WCD73_15170 [Pseudolabrys sp.]